MLQGEVRWQLIELEAPRADSDLLLNHNNHQQSQSSTSGLLLAYNLLPDGDKYNMKHPLYILLLKC